MYKLLTGLLVVAMLALIPGAVSAKGGWAKNASWHSGKIYKHANRGHHYGWYLGRGNPHRF
jgi:hypothetical protein